MIEQLSSQVKNSEIWSMLLEHLYFCHLNSTLFDCLLWMGLYHSYQETFHQSLSAHC